VDPSLVFSRHVCPSPESLTGTEPEDTSGEVAATFVLTRRVTTQWKCREQHSMSFYRLRDVSQWQ
jgi:hypothetical protein